LAGGRFEKLPISDAGYQLKGQPAAAFNADVGTELPPGVELHPVPNEVAARVPQTRGYRYVVANDRVLLVGTSRIVVGVFADAARPSRKGRLAAVCMFVCALIIIGLAVTGVLQLRWARLPAAHVVAK